MKQFMTHASSHIRTCLVSELEMPDLQLIEHAIQALDRAYAPYSKFHVGSAIRLENEHIILGANQENASYPLCMCGERVALYNSSVNYPGVKILSMAIVAHNKKLKIEKPVSPCGACRQVISEYENRQSATIRILLKGDGDEVMILDGIEALLPYSFDGSFLL